MTYAQSLRERRLATGLSQDDFAVIAGVLREDVSRWEREERTPNRFAVEKLEAAFRVLEGEAAIHAALSRLEAGKVNQQPRLRADTEATLRALEFAAADLYGVKDGS